MFVGNRSSETIVNCNSHTRRSDVVIDVPRPL